MSDLFSQLQRYEKGQATKFPTSGTIARIDGDRIDVAVAGSSSILRHVKCVGAPTSKGQIVLLTWENGTPTAHITGGSASSADVALVRGPQGPEGPQGLAGPQGPEGPVGSVSAASSLNFTELAGAPAAPAPGTLITYAKADHKVYQRSSDGTEKEIGATPTVRELLTANRTYYVRTDGNDNNNGLSNTAGGAFLTIQKAIDTAASIDTSMYNITIQAGDGTYAAGTITCRNIPGTGTVTITGNTGNMDAVTIDGGFSKASPGTTYYLQYMKLTKSSSSVLFGIIADNKGKIYFSNINFSTGLTYHLWAQSFGEIWCNGPYTISGGASYHVVSTRQGNVTIYSCTVTLTGTPAINFVTCDGVSFFYAYNITFSGTATGNRYSVGTNGVINTFGGGPNYFPGSVAGVAASGGQYV